VFLPLEALFHPIRRLSEEIVKGVGQSAGEKQDFIKIITKPFTDKVIQMNIKKVLAEVTKVSFFYWNYFMLMPCSHIQHCIYSSNIVPTI